MLVLLVLLVLLDDVLAAVSDDVLDVLDADVDADGDADVVSVAGVVMAGNDDAMAVTACVNDEIMLNNDLSGCDADTAVVNAFALDSLIP